MTHLQPLLAVNHVSVSFNRAGGGFWRKQNRSIVQAVRDVSFALQPGETLGIVGESGCGKTTLGRAIAQFQKIDSGSIVLDGADLAAYTPRELRKNRHAMQMVFQNPYASLNGRMTIYDTLAEALLVSQRLSSSALHDAVAASLTRVGLDSSAMQKFPHEFSGGQRQRIAIARALAPQPKLILADEPVSSLDVSVAAQVLNVLHELRDTLNLTMLFISHDLSVVKYIAHSIAVMYRGAIVEYGTSDELFAHPMHPYTETLLRAIPIPDPHVAQKLYRNDSVPVTHDVDAAGGCRFAPRCRYAQDSCLVREPQLEGTLHRVACFRSGEITLSR